jgi:DNA-directed RNA polymerase subunit delta
MATILGLKAIYDTRNMAWAIELALDGEPGSHRFKVANGEEVESFLEAFEESTDARYDPASGEVAFAFEYAFDDEDDDREDDEEDEDEEREAPASSKTGT